MSTDRDTTRNLLLQMDSGLLEFNPMFRQYLTATLECQKFRSRRKDRSLRRWLWSAKILLLLSLFGILAQRIWGGPTVPETFWPISILSLASTFALLNNTPRERTCRQYYECLLHLSVGQAPPQLPYLWQTGMTSECLRKYAESLEWELEWNLRRRESRTVFVLMAGLFLYVLMTFELFGGPLIPFWSCCGGHLG
mgnify:CR=1 FL=1